MYIPTDNELKEARYRFERLMYFVALGQVPIGTVLEAVQTMTPEEGGQISRVPWSVDCSVAPKIDDAEVVSHHAYGDLQVIADGILDRTKGNLQIETGLLDRFLVGRAEDTIPMRIGDKLLPTANLALYVFERQHLIPPAWWDKTVVMPGTVYEEAGSRRKFVLGLVSRSASKMRTMFGEPEEISPSTVRLERVGFSQLRHASDVWCAVMLNR